MSRSVLCRSCNVMFSLRDFRNADKTKCLHCIRKDQHGVVDINNCFKGSVIILED